MRNERREDVIERYSQTIVDAIESLEAHDKVESVSLDTQSNVIAEGVTQGLTDGERSASSVYVMVGLTHAYTEEQYRTPVEEALTDFDWELADDSWGGRTNFRTKIKVTK